jgi:hypothetical protein
MELIKTYRITVFVPPNHLDALIAGICAVDPLDVGTYEHVMWSMAGGKEQFRPASGANPTVGKIGELSVVDTVRLEVCIPRDPQRLQDLIEKGIFPHHPWEVPAVFVDESSFPVK